MSTEADKYIVDFSVREEPDGTEFLILQLNVGGENSTFKISLNAIKSFVLEGTGTMRMVDDVPDDDTPYVRVHGQWVKLSEYIGGSPL